MTWNYLFMSFNFLKGIMEIDIVKLEGLIIRMGMPGTQSEVTMVTLFTKATPIQF